jgi:parvulin-like peptidyl-prolyl cis-trans isomerase-like protein
MQRWVTTLVGFAVVVLTVWVVARNFTPPKPIGHDPSPHAAGDAGAERAAAASIAPADRGDDGGSPVLVEDLLAASVRVDGGVGATLFDGTPVPPLPFGGPREVRFGVVLVSYAGAQPSAERARPSTRSRDAARDLAEKLSATAQQDFHAAVQQGDAGSADDVGRVKRGILEPAPEYVLFSLSKDGVGGPIDTPRGFWIVKRLE